MKKQIKNNYALIILSLFLINNLIFRNIIISGILYQIFMIFIIILNVLTIYKLRKEIKWKTLTIISFFLALILSKNLNELAFGISSMITFILIGFKESTLNKVLSIVITIIFIIVAIPLLYLYTFISAFTGDDYNPIYEDSHYYCKKNYEIYVSSASAMDHFHYNIIKQHTFLDNTLISIQYKKRKEVSQKEYDNFYKNHKCKLIGDENEHKKNS